MTYIIKNTRVLLCALIIMTYYQNAISQNVKILKYNINSGTYSKKQEKNQTNSVLVQENEQNITEFYTLRGERKASHHQEVFSDVIFEPDAKAMRVIFDRVNLGKESYVKIESLTDQATQILDATSMADWKNASAYFNGNKIRVSLHVATGDEGVFFNTSGVMAETVKIGEIITYTQCGSSDNRVLSSDPAIGRFTNGNGAAGTGWICSNGSILTAGHVWTNAINPLNYNLIEFNVPLSDNNGSVNHPGPEDQYPLSQGWVQDDGLGNDWAVFTCNPNANTGLLPAQGQQAFYRMSRDHSPSTIRITGYGDDTGNRYRVQQTHSGSNEGETNTNANRIYWSYRADTENSNSGSPVIYNGLSTPTAIGIHTNGGCTTSGGANKGVSFENNSLEQNIHQVWGSQSAAKYVDRGDIVTSEDGSVLRPYNTVLEGVNAVSSGGTVPVVSGNYNESMTINKPVTLVAPVGNVHIGTSNGGAITSFTTADVAFGTAQELEQVTTNYQEVLLTVYPNPNEGEFEIDADFSSMNLSAPATLTVYSRQGNLVFTQKIHNKASLSFNMRQYPRGIYIAKLQIPGEEAIFKRIIYQ